MKFYNRMAVGGVLLVGGLFIASNGYGIFGCSSMVVGLVIAFVGQAAHDLGPFPTRAEGLRDLRHLTGELTQEERLAEKQAERETHNKNARSAAAWGPRDDYVDYDGNTRTL